MENTGSLSGCGRSGKRFPSSSEFLTEGKGVTHCSHDKTTVMGRMQPGVEGCINNA